MSKPTFDRPAGQPLAVLLLLIGMLLMHQITFGEERRVGENPAPAPSVPMIVKARPGDTSATLARRYLHDAGKAWMIEAYNGRTIIDPNEAVIIPVAPFRLGGLAPDGFQTVPVLAYTQVDHSDLTGTEPFTAAFGQQLSWLERNAYRTVTPAQLTTFFTYTGQLPRRAVLISIDSEALPVIDRIAPLIKEAGFTATVFVATDHVGEPGNMTWDHLKQLRRDGFTIGCRGKNGRSLARRKRGQSVEANIKWIQAELEGAKKAIEAHLGEPCLFLAYPEGGANSLVAAMAARIGFTAAFTLSPGENPFFTDRFRIHRAVVDNRKGLDRFGQQTATWIEADLQ